MASYKKLGKDMYFMTIGTFGSRLLSFVFVPFYTAVLTTEEYGTADLITTTVTLMLPFFTLIIFEAMMRFALEKEIDQGAIWNIGMKIEGIGILIFLIISPVFNFTILKEYYIFIVANYVITSLNRCVSYFVRGLNKIKIFAFAGTLQTGILVGANLVFLLILDAGIEGYLLSQILAAVVATLFMFVAAKLYRFRFDIIHVDKRLQREMLRYSIPMIPNSVSWWIANASDRYILTAFSGAAANGIYSVAYKIPTIISTLMSIFGNAWKLSAVEEFGTEKSQKFFEDIFSKLTALMLLTVSVLLVINKPLARILFSKEFYQAWQTVPLLLIAAAMHAYAEFYGSIYTSSYKTNFLVYSTVAGSFINIVLNLLLIPKLEAMGAAIATAIGYFIIWISRVFNSRKIMKLHINWKRDSIAYMLMIVQIFIACNQFKFELITSGIIFLMILFLMRTELAGLMSIMLKKVKLKGTVLK